MWACPVLQVVLRHSHNAAEIGDEVRGKITEFALRGFRALGVAVTDDISHKRESPHPQESSPSSLGLWRAPFMASHACMVEAGMQPESAVTQHLRVEHQ